MVSINTLTHCIIYGFTILGLFATPSSLGKYRWVFLYWFLGVNLVLFSGLANTHFLGLPLVMLGISQIPWLAIAFFFMGSQRRGVNIVPQEWGYWGLFRLMNVHYFLYLLSDDLPFGFIVVIGGLETAMGLFSLTLFHPSFKNPVSRIGFLLWNSIGLISAWMINSQIQLNVFWKANDPVHRMISAHFQQFPEVWISSFWVPVSICIHAVLIFQYITQGTGITRGK